MMWSPDVMVFVFLAVGAVALFSFLAINSWSDARRKERESYYKNDMLKKLADSQGPGAASALELMREEARLSTIRMRQGLQIGGLVTAAVGLALMVFLGALPTGKGVFLCGLIPLLIGIALYGGSFLVKTAQDV
ncbi:MAG: hypothetical protein WBW84_08360 [Acidobacteriaceae bacterium]